MSTNCHCGRKLSYIVFQPAQEITVVLKTPVPKTTPLEDLNKWDIAVGLKGLPRVDCHPAKVIVDPKSREYVILTLPPNTLVKDFASVSVAFDSGPFFSYAAQPTNGSFSAASSKTDSDNYLTGTYSPAFHSAASYNIDAKGSLDIWGLLRKSNVPKPYLGVTATVATDNRPSADPDSFLVSGLAGLVLTHRRFLWERAQGALLDWKFAGLEFDRKTTTKTFISSPIVEVPIRLSAAPNPDTHLFSDMFPYFGVEMGQT